MMERNTYLFQEQGFLGSNPGTGTQAVSYVSLKAKLSSFASQNIANLEEGRSSNLRYVWIRIPPPVLCGNVNWRHNLNVHQVGAEIGGLQR